MTRKDNYWLRRSVSRRRFLGTSAATAAGVTGLVTIGCGDDDDDDQPPPATAEATAADAATAAAEEEATAAATAAAATAAATAAAEEEAASTPAPSTEEQPKQGGILRINNNVRPPHFDPWLSTGAGVSTSLGLFYSRLTRHIPSADQAPTDFSNPQPDLADSWEISDDGLSVTFHLRDARFQQGTAMNGRAFTSEDAKFTLELIGSGPHRVVVASIDQVETPDPKTLRLSLKHPNLDLVPVLGTEEALMTGPEGMEETGDYRTTVAGTGPYMFGGYDEGQELRFDRNPDFHFEGRPHLDGIVMNFASDAAASKAAVLSGNVHIAGGVGLGGYDKPTFEDLASTGNFNTFQFVPVTLTHSLFIGPGWAPGQDIRIREALARAVDRQQVINIASFGEGNISGPVPHAFEGALPQDEVMGYYGFDPGRARSLVEAYGGDVAGEIEISFYLYSEATRTVSQLIQTQLQDVGLDIVLRELQFGEHYQTWTGGDFDLRESAQFLQTTAAGYLDMLHSQGGQNYQKINDPALDAIIDKFRVEFDSEARLALQNEAEHYILSNYYYLNLVNDINRMAFPKVVRDWYPQSPGYAYPQAVTSAWLDA